MRSAGVSPADDGASRPVVKLANQAWQLSNHGFAPQTHHRYEAYDTLAFY